MKELKTLKQYPDNVFVRDPVYGRDWDIYAIRLIKSGEKITASDVDEYYSHVLTYLHEDAGTVESSGWVVLNIKDPAERLQYVKNSCLNLKRIVESYDPDLYKKVFTKSLAEKYSLKADCVPGSKTVAFVNSLALAKPRKARNTVKKASK